MKRGCALSKRERERWLFVPPRLLRREGNYTSSDGLTIPFSERETVRYKLQLLIFGRRAETKSLPYRERRTGPGRQGGDSVYLHHYLHWTTARWPVVSRFSFTFNFLLASLTRAGIYYV